MQRSRPHCQNQAPNALSLDIVRTNHIVFSWTFYALAFFLASRDTSIQINPSNIETSSLFKPKIPSYLKCSIESSWWIDQKTWDDQSTDWRDTPRLVMKLLIILYTVKWVDNFLLGLCFPILKPFQYSYVHESRQMNWVGKFISRKYISKTFQLYQELWNPN